MRDKSKLATWLPILISVAALSVSLGSLYYDHWREKHSLKAVISHLSWGEKQVVVEIVLHNLGNKPEVLKEASLIWNNADPGGGAVSEENVGPLVIKAEESVVQELTVQAPTFKDLKSSNLLDRGNGLHVGVIFSILDFRPHSTGSKIYVEKTIPFTVIYFDDNGRVTRAKPTTEMPRLLLNYIVAFPSSREPGAWGPRFARPLG
jgi:hypothetical protein